MEIDEVLKVPTQHFLIYVTDGNKHVAYSKGNGARKYKSILSKWKYLFPKFQNKFETNIDWIS